MNNLLFGIFSLILFSISLNGQTNLTQGFRFESGVYLTFEEFQNNTPTYDGAAIEGNFFINKSTKQAKVEYIRLKETKKNLDLDKLWGIVIKGIPYVKASPNFPDYHLKVFATMEVRGNICYFSYDDIENKDIPFKVYNPLLGIPFRTSIIKRRIPVIKEKILKFETGAVADFNYKNLLEWLAADSDITKALKSLGEKKAEEKLFDALLLYNDKYSVSLK